MGPDDAVAMATVATGTVNAELVAEALLTAPEVAEMLPARWAPCRRRRSR
ncbi:MAG: hypothetical protein IPL19_13340 [Sandaracinaceae bacterium]|nr:hypothetical protein [Sandaracinaceae bacterium]